MSDEICFSRNIVNEVAFEWKIDGFLSSPHEDRCSLTGPTFMMPTQPERMWETFLDCNGTSFNSEIYSFRAQPLKFGYSTTFKLSYDLSARSKEILLAACSNQLCFGGSQNIIKMNFPWIRLPSALTDNMIPLDDKELVLKCRFGVVSSCVSDIKTQKESSENDFNCLSDSLRTLLSSEMFSDFTIVIEKKSFPVHKCILSSRSPVFAAMFRSDTVEVSSGKLLVKDFKIKTMETFLSFIYTGKLDNLSSDEYCELYSVSDKYAVLSLKEILAQKLAKSISIDNVCDVYTLGYNHVDVTIKAAAINYMKENALSVLISKNWRNLILQNKDLAEKMIDEADLHETATIKVTNLSEDVKECDLRELFRPFGTIARIYLAKDKLTGQSKGFAFISYHRRNDAATAIEVIHGFKYDDLILSVEWAK